MSILRSFVVLFLGCAISGCGTILDPPPRLDGKAPNVRLGPTLEFLNADTAHDLIRIVPESAQRAHVLIASTGLKQVFDFVVRPDGPMERRVIRSGISPSTIDAAIDKDGRLHVLIDAEHMILEEGVGHASARNPWQGTGFGAHKPGFVRGAPDLTWTFQVSGKDIGSPGRWELGGIGGLMFPIHSTSTKTLLVAEHVAGYANYAVLEPDTNVDTPIVDAVSDTQGNVHAIYGNSATRYLRVAAQDLRPIDTGVADVSRLGARAPPLRSIRGEGVLEPYETLSLVIDPGTGTLLIGQRWLVRGGTWTELKAAPFVPVKLAPAGADSFHAIGFGKAGHCGAANCPIYYSMFSELEWSAPVQLGLAGVSHLLGLTTADVASVSNDKALVVWQTRSGIVGRWIERLP